ncbi:cation-transporting ATPase [Actinoplanes sp. SE50]|uniref:heavy metal translocating P-type ATPase n=1 Tax=unclassified Actinoplanes TaxID=2626549 RepID=UPI00023EC2A4|nr:MULTISPECIES: heavy metal translocating P-type ATPase [unclassified Actinoplanes]AEV84612.1 cation transporter P-type ATPase D [Actinoplanes sp. SE50/110]ATO83004.1 cation-transporting ATPase [Actinoplanes sp. SE50]SLM00412.1 metal-transporting ATPase [Actinoplanes sp. SE50/110]
MTPSTAAPHPAAGAPKRRLVSRMGALPEIRWATLATLLFAAGGITQLAGAPTPLWWVLYLACYAAGGWEPALAGLQALRERTLDVDLLMIVAAIGAAAIGQVFDGALLIVIFATSGALEAFATARTADSVRALLDLAPERATRVDADGTEHSVPTGELQVDHVIRIRPGERIGADARVIDGASEVDQATITGEPLPVAKTGGDEVFAGTLNGTGTLLARVDKAAGESVIARIVALVEEASASKAETQLFIEKVERRYSLGVVVATLALFAVPLLSGADPRTTLLRAMTFMIVASPCAVVLATMPPLLSSIALAGRHGVLVKSAVVMERLADTGMVAFDKTGTLTAGTPGVAEIHPAGPFTERDLLRLAAAAEHASEHPVAAAVVSAARERGLVRPVAEDFASAPGRGVRALVDGRLVQVGSPVLLDTVTAHRDEVAEVRATTARAQDAGRTAVIVLVDGRPAGVIGLADRIRPAATASVTALAQLTGARPVLLTGDNAGAAARLATEAGITEVHAGLLPADKVERVRTLQDGGRRVLLVGDGVNDAPALAAADLGVAMGGRGSDLALSTADAVLVRDDLTALPAVIALSRRARRLVVANLIIAASFITVLVCWDLFGHLPLPLGVAGHEGSTVIVGLNGLRLLSARAWRHATKGAAA